MLEIIRKSKFKKDVKRLQKQQKDMAKLKQVLHSLLTQQPLHSKYKDHVLVGNYASRRELHIEPDWLLIYAIERGILYLERTGSHSDLFK